MSQKLCETALLPKAQKYQGITTGIEKNWNDESEIGLGCMGLSMAYAPPAEEGQALVVIEPGR